MPLWLHPIHVGLAVGAIVLLSNCVVVELAIGDVDWGLPPAASAAEVLDDAGVY